MTNNDIGVSFQRLLFDSFYRYKGYRAEKRANGTLLVLNRIMTIPEFHEWVDGIYDAIDKSVEKAFNSVSPHQMDCPRKP